MSQSFDAYEIDRAIKPISLFIEDLSTWYIRRSRDRFKSDDMSDRTHAVLTTRTILMELSKLIAPVMPFIAEHLYSRAGGRKESVHLEQWPISHEADLEILERMAEVRRIVSVALEDRARAGLKVRQPLSSVTIPATLKIDIADEVIITDELNVKKVIRSNDIDAKIEVDKEITLELKKEGQFREILRTVQGLRKDSKLEPSDVITLNIKTTEEGKALVDAFSDELKKIALIIEIKKIEIIGEIKYGEVAGEPIDIEGMSFTFLIEK